MAELATIARPYAEALFKVGKSAANFEQVQQWLDPIAAAASNEDVQRIAESPKVSQDEVFSLLTSVVPAGLPAVAQNFLRVVLGNGRLAALPEVAAQYRALVNAQKGAADGIVYSAFPLSEVELSELRATLEKRFGQHLNLTVQVDESLIGGVRVVVGDEELDTSVKARLEQMKAALVA